MEADWKDVAHYLKQRMPSSMYERLKEASKDFSIPLFAVDPQTGVFECVIHDESPDGDELLVDAACTACELLSASDVDFRDDRSIVPDADDKGEILFEYRFDPIEESVYNHFRNLLTTPEQRKAGVRATADKRPGELYISVRVRYDSDFDYQQKKDSLDWMLHLARKKANNSPFSGRKL